MSDPSTEDLRSVFDDLVGAPRPSGDLAERARRRGTALRRQRLSVVSAGVATVAVLVVPSVIAIRHDVSSGFGPGSGGSKAKATAPASGKPALTKTDAPGQPGTIEQKQRALIGTTLGAPPKGPDSDSYIVGDQALTAKDTSRIDAAKYLLGSPFTASNSGVAISERTGKAVGTSATFETAAGESVGIVWATIDAAEQGNSASTKGTAGGTTGGEVGAGVGANVGAKASGDKAADTLQTLGGAAVKGNLQISIKAVLPAHGTPVLTTQKVNDLLTALLAQE